MGVCVCVCDAAKYAAATSGTFRGTISLSLLDSIPDIRIPSVLQSCCLTAKKESALYKVLHLCPKGSALEVLPELTVGYSG